MSDMSSSGARSGHAANTAHARATMRSAMYVLVALLVCATLPSRADAQFGKLMKKVAKKAAGQADASATSAAVPAPAFNGNVLEITDARIGQLLKGLDAERAERPKLQQQDAAAQTAYETALGTYAEQKKAYDRDLAAYQKKFDAYESCTERVEAKYEKEAAGDPSPEDQERADNARDAELDARAQRLQSLAERLQAANARGDDKAGRALADSLRRESSAAMAIGSAEQEDARKSRERDQRREADRAKCGDPGKRPVEPTPPSAINHDNGYVALKRAGVQASGLSDIQYAILRERVAAYVNVQGDFPVGNKYAFSEDELSVLQHHLRELTDRGADLAPYGAWRFAPKGS